MITETHSGPTKKELPYWIAIAHLPRWRKERINGILIDWIHEKSKPLSELFQDLTGKATQELHFTPKEIQDLEKAAQEIPNNAFLAEELLEQGYRLIPITDDLYPPAFKQHLRKKHAPPLLYMKGNPALLHEKAMAIVGSRKAGQPALDFTSRVAKKAAQKGQVVVSGNAKGVDRQAMESALEADGKSIVILPQGILTFGPGFKQLHQPLVNGQLLVMSTFPPRAKWSKGLAMARNPLIYGLTEEIFVAGSASTGGTWEGVMDGLKKGRIIHVRQPESTEDNANNLLIEKGCTPVDRTGKVVSSPSLSGEEDNEPVPNEVNETASLSYAGDDFHHRLKKALQTRPLTSKEIKEAVNIEWSVQQLTAYLKKQTFVEEVPGTSPKKFRIGSQRELGF